MELIRGKDVAAAMTEKVAAEVQRLQEAGHRTPVLAIVRIGERPEDLAYERGANTRMKKCGITVESHVFPEDVAEETFLKAWEEINARETVDGILLFMPLPKQIDTGKVIAKMDPAKDMDGITTINQGKIFRGEKDGYAPCTAEAVMETLHFAGIDVKGLETVVVGRSNVIGKPVSMLLLSEHATVTICHTRTKDLQAELKRADLVVACAGVAEMIDGSMIKEGAIVMDVGINGRADGSICGDVKTESLEGIAALATPVPGGIGSVTTSVLADHVLRAFCAGQSDNR